MEVTKTNITGVFVIEPKIFKDQRGYFFESYNKLVLQNFGITYTFVQDNQSKSTYGVIRGLHFQNPPYTQTKLVRVLAGKIIDVAVDVRKNSPTYGQHVSVELSDDNCKQLLIPEGFAHGFLVLSEIATFFYKCDNFYNKESEGGLIFNDETVNINWNFPTNELLISEKDQVLPNLENARKVW